MLLLALVAVSVVATTGSRQNLRAPVAVAINPINVVETASPPDSLINNSNIVCPSITTNVCQTSTFVLPSELSEKPAIVPESPGEVIVLKLPLMGQQIG